MLTCPAAFLRTSPSAWYNPLYLAGTFFVALTAVVELKVEAQRRVLVEREALWENVGDGLGFRHVVHDGQ